jgi:hypothetical protein
MKNNPVTCSVIPRLSSNGDMFSSWDGTGDARRR